MHLKEKTMQQIIDVCSKMARHFKHSSVAKYALEQKQEQTDFFAKKHINTKLFYTLEPHVFHVRQFI